MSNKNNFDLVRLVLAFIVLLVHGAAVSRSESLHFLLQLFSGSFAVKGFFAISGYLIALSFHRCRSWRDYAEKRARRIIPAYLLTIVACIISGAALTSYPLSEFFLSKTTLKYALANISFMNFIQPSLPGVFLNNPVQSMDGSLWTIKAELTLYALLPLVFPLMKSRPFTCWLIIYLISCGWFYYFTWVYSGAKADMLAKQFVSLSSYFFFGTLVALSGRVADRLREIAVISLVLFILSRDTMLSQLVQPVAFSSVVLLFCLGMFKQVPAGRYGDFSYGVYLFHWPVIQVLIDRGWYSASPWGGLVLTVLITTLLAVISWYFVEKRFLKKKPAPHSKGRMPAAGQTLE
ncbi:acyltransferase [Pantoea sp. BAV 3049]|uniref:acyltransferase family protein n=1 Tax=Pantoea sp. BAV 3049 TaxID=2654188 RepID=UPI00131C5F72|nr:acyltransferase [Pantoea sp. BAV 3049]